MRISNRFIDPVTGFFYDWAINHNDETGSPSKGGGQGGVSRNFTISAPTSLGLHIRQQAADDVISFSWKGTALTRLQHQEFLAWYHLCSSHSIYLRDFSGDTFEVMITAYIPKRRRVSANRNDPVNAPLWVYDYQIDIDVIASVAGDYAAWGL